MPIYGCVWAAGPGLGFPGLELVGVAGVVCAGGDMKDRLKIRRSNMNPVANRPLYKILDIFVTCWCRYLCRISKIVTCSMSSRIKLRGFLAWVRNLVK